MGPSATTCPRDRTSARSHISYATGRSCVTMIFVTVSCRRILMSCRLALGSRFRRWLVQDEHLRAHGEDGRGGYPLLLPKRQVVSRAVLEPGHPHRG